jgi:uncharacterized radical SAM superfamily Fe-S cluster-containing enzyme
MLLKKTKSLCPTCMSVLEADIIDEDGRVWMIRTCPEHGSFKDLYWSDADMYRRYDRSTPRERVLKTRRSSLRPMAVPPSAGSAAITNQERFLQISISPTVAILTAISALQTHGHADLSMNPRLTRSST